MGEMKYVGPHELRWLGSSNKKMATAARLYLYEVLNGSTFEGDKVELLNATIDYMSSDEERIAYLQKEVVNVVPEYAQLFNKQGA